MLAEISSTELGAIILTIAAAIAAAYTMGRKTIRSERSADIKAKIDDRNTELDAELKGDEKASDYWRRQYDEKVKSDQRFMERLTVQITDLYAKYKASEDAHIECRREHAETVGELAALHRQNKVLEDSIVLLRQQNSQQEERIRRLEHDLAAVGREQPKAGVS